MESLYLLLPMSVLLVLALIGLFAWALHSGQFDDLEREGLRVLDEPDAPEAPGDPAAPGVAAPQRAVSLERAQDSMPSPIDNS